MQTKIQDLGPEFHEVLNQSSETWHDNAPFDAVRDKQSLLYAEYSHLKYVLLNSEKAEITKSTTIGIGSTAGVRRGSTTRSYFIAGDWTPYAGEKNDSGALITSCQSPIAKAIIGKEVHDQTDYGTIVSLM